MTAPVDTVESMARELGGEDDCAVHPSGYRCSCMTAWRLRMCLLETCGDAEGEGRDEDEPPVICRGDDGLLRVTTGWGFRWSWKRDWPHDRLRALIARERAARGLEAAR